MAEERQLEGSGRGGSGRSLRPAPKSSPRSAPKRSKADSQLRKSLDKLNRQANLLDAIGSEAVTERQILNRVGDNRYTREILRKLLSMEVVVRTGKGGSCDPFRYRSLRKNARAEIAELTDPVLEARMKRIETKIISLLGETSKPVSERCIRNSVGDNTGTGKALRRLVQRKQVMGANNLTN